MSRREDHAAEGMTGSAVRDGYGLQMTAQRAELRVRDSCAAGELSRLTAQGGNAYPESGGMGAEGCLGPGQ